MNTLITPAQKPPIQSFSRESVRFHLLMAAVFAAVLLLTAIGFRLKSIHYPDLGGLAIGLFVVFVILAPIPLYFHEKGQQTQRDCALMVPWTLLLGLILPFPVLIAGRLGMPLRDSLFANADHLMKMNVPEIVAWAGRHHRVAAVLSHSYDLLQPMMLVGVLLPALTGKLNSLKEFLIANIITISATIAIFACLPAVGPWLHYHLHASAAQQECELQIRALRSAAPYFAVHDGAGVVCFPSFHVAEAVLCAAVLWAIRLLRFPAALLASLITISTLTTGWHYFVDVLGGIALAAVSIAAAKVYIRMEANRESARRAMRVPFENPTSLPGHL